MCHYFLDQSVVNRAIDEWRRRLSACVDAEGGHFEQSHVEFLLNENDIKTIKIG